MTTTQESIATKEQQHSIDSATKALKTSPGVVPLRKIPSGLSVEAWFEWSTANPEPLEDLLERFSDFPSVFHVVAGMNLGQLGLCQDTTRLMAHYADTIQDNSEALKARGLDRIRFILEQRQHLAASEDSVEYPGLPSLEVCQSLWSIDPDSPTGLRSVRTGLPIKGEPRANSLTVTYRASGAPRVRLNVEDIIERLSGRDELADPFMTPSKEDRPTVTDILPHELDALNELFPPHARLGLIDTRIRYNNRNSPFRTWDPVAREVIYDTPTLLEDIRKNLGQRTYERWVALAESGVNLAGPLCAHLRIPLTKGTLMYADPNHAKRS